MWGTIRKSKGNAYDTDISLLKKIVLLYGCPKGKGTKRTGGERNEEGIQASEGVLSEELYCLKRLKRDPAQESRERRKQR